MKTKAQIVQELLDKKLITAEDAIVLLQGEIQYVPYQIQPQPYINPYQQPTMPFWWQYPITIS